MKSIYYILVCTSLQKFALIPGFPRHTAISPSVLCCANW